MSKLKDFKVYGKNGVLKFIARIDKIQGNDRYDDCGLAIKWAIDNNISLIGSVFTDGILSDCKIENVNFTESKIDRFDFDSDILNSNFSKANIECSIFNYINISNTDFTKANLSMSHFNESKITNSSFNKANLYRVDFTGCNLSYIDFFGADIYGVDFSDCVIKDTIFPNLNIPKIHDIHKAVYNSVIVDGSFDMHKWHSRCGTSHCRAGHVIKIAGKEGYSLETEVGTSAAAALIYYASDPKISSIPSWYVSNKDAMQDIKLLAGK